MRCCVPHVSQEEMGHLDKALCRQQKEIEVKYSFAFIIAFPVIMVLPLTSASTLSYLAQET